jgi:polyhydroxyalkanoate synthesis regulator phasin
MVDKPAETRADDATPAAAATVIPPRRSPGHRNADARDTVAEMAARAQEISQEAGSKVAQAMKDVIGAAAGLAGFAVESARDLVQYMVRRGQMTQEEADKLIREAEEASSKRPRPAPVAAPAVVAVASATPAASAPVVRSAPPAAKAPAAKKAAPPSRAKVAAKKAPVAAKKKAPSRNGGKPKKKR